VTSDDLPALDEALSQLAVADPQAPASAGDNTVSVLLGNTNNTSRPAQTSATDPGPVPVVAGDLYADGIPDLVAAGQTVDVLPGLGDGTFPSPIHYSANGSG
jgi:hypothetical protein